MSTIHFGLNHETFGLNFIHNLESTGNSLVKKKYQIVKDLFMEFLLYANPFSNTQYFNLCISWNINDWNSNQSLFFLNVTDLTYFNSIINPIYICLQEVEFIRPEQFVYEIVKTGSGKRRSFINNIFRLPSRSDFYTMINLYIIRPTVVKSVGVETIRQRRNYDTESNDNFYLNGVIINE
ncbi:hypothetical protein H8356DRAFT_1360136 [Neocallimastix lanati (nom. inval.)]|nr:hypothetical protein H8356DRAFT_1360136 [Neocallimastix sp. JGI-2020a]